MQNGPSTTAKITRRPTMADVARAAGVSPATVSYVISGRRGNGTASRISADTRSRVHNAMRDIGYAINEPARHLRRNRTDRVLLVLDRYSSPYEQRLAATLDAAFTRTGRTMSIVVCSSLERLEIALDAVPRRLADGAIVACPTMPGMQALLERLTMRQVPLVAISSGLNPIGFDVVASDETGAIEQAIDHLVAKGHRRIGFLAHTLDDPLPEQRLTIVRQRLATHGLALDADVTIAGARDRVASFTSVQALLDRPEPPTALYSASDIGAISALWATRSRGRRVPDDLAIIGTGNIDETTITTPQLSTVGPIAPDFAAIARMLSERLDAGEVVAGRRQPIPWHFVPRASS